MPVNITSKKVGGKVVFRNMADLENYSKELILQVQQETLDKMYEKLMEIIDRRVYNAYQPVAYERTKEFKTETFEISEPYIDGGVVRGNIKAKENFDTYITYEGSPFFQHQGYNSVSGSDYDKAYRLTGMELAKIIDEGIDALHSMYGEIEARPFWDEFTKWAKSNYGRIFANIMRKYNV